MAEPSGRPPSIHHGRLWTTPGKGCWWGWGQAWRLEEGCGGGEGSPDGPQSKREAGAREGTKVETGIPPAGDASMGLALLCPLSRAGPAWHTTSSLKAGTPALRPAASSPGPWKGGEVQNQIICLLPKASSLKAFGGHPGPGPASPAANWTPAMVQDKARTLVTRAEAKMCWGRGGGKWLLVTVGNFGISGPTVNASPAAHFPRSLPRCWIASRQ